MKFETCGVESGWVFLSRVTQRPVEAVKWIARHIDTLMDQGWSTRGIRRLVKEDLEQKPWQW